MELQHFEMTLPKLVSFSHAGCSCVCVPNTCLLPLSKQLLDF